MHEISHVPAQKRMDMFVFQHTCTKHKLEGFHVNTGIKSVE